MDNHKSDHRRRFLAFVDFLGTRELYSDAVANAGLILDRRHELEHAIQIRLQQLLASRQIEIGVFSDTVLIAGDSASAVIRAASELLEFCFAKNIRRDSPNDIRQLRGGISAGIELRAGYLAPSARVHTIPFFDGSLAFAYELEGIRRGSRLFLDTNVTADLDEELQRYVFSWQHAPGFGKPVAPLKEILWPAVATADAPTRLPKMLTDSFNLWRRAVSSGTPSPDRYRQTTYHWDETIKVILRSLIIANNSNDTTTDVLSKILPSDLDRMQDCNIRYLWGIWFQVFLVIGSLNLAGTLEERIRLTIDELKSRNYFANFVAEADYEDYATVKKLLDATM